MEHKTILIKEFCYQMQDEQIDKVSGDDAFKKLLKNAFKEATPRQTVQIAPL